MFRLRSYDISPPGGYPYVQSDGIRRVFRAEPLIEVQARNVSSFRSANHLPRASLAESLQDVDCFQCQRMGNMSTYCIDTGATPTMAISQTSPILNTGCKGCGMPVSQ